jgi:hypothetical protein
MAAFFQVSLDATHKSLVGIMPVAEKDAYLDKRLLRHELVFAVVADHRVRIWNSHHLRRLAIGATNDWVHDYLLAPAYQYYSFPLSIFKKLSMPNST